MTDSGVWGARDAKGEWQPEELPKPNPLFERPLKLKTILKYHFGFNGFFWPFNLFYALLAAVSWIYFTPALERTVHFEWGWVAEIYLRNAVLLTLIAGGLHFWLYIRKGQGTAFKYTKNWLTTQNAKFTFKNQTYDNVFWSLTSGCMIWTACEALSLWAYANGKLPYVSWRTHPVYCVLLMAMIPVLRYIHFYWVHRLSHWTPLFRISHYLHHRNVNVGPWSGLSMHPIEHLLYFSGFLMHWIIPSHPLHMIFHLMHAGVSPALGHTGFHKLVAKNERGIIADNYFHYLHHRYFTVNFGVEALPLDLWFGSYNDGSAKGNAAMLARRARLGNRVS